MTTATTPPTFIVRFRSWWEDRSTIAKVGVVIGIIFLALVVITVCASGVNWLQTRQQLPLNVGSATQPAVTQPPATQTGTGEQGAATQTPAGAAASMGAVATGETFFSIPEGSFPLETEDNGLIGVAYVLSKPGPYTAKTPWGATTTIALGPGKVSGKVMPTDAKGTIGNIVVIQCAETDGCDTVIEDYVPGHVAITTVFNGFETPNETVGNALSQMFKAPNCGASGCNPVNVFNGDKQDTYTAPSTLNISPLSLQVKTNIVGEVPSNASVILYQNAVVGHQFEINEENSVSAPEGGVTMLVCMDKTCTLNGQSYSGVVVINGNPSDDATPKDLNMTLTSNGQVRVVFIYGNTAAMKGIVNSLAGPFYTYDGTALTEVKVEDLTK